MAITTAGSRASRVVLKCARPLRPVSRFATPDAEGRRRLLLLEQQHKTIYTTTLQPQTMGAWRTRVMAARTSQRRIMATSTTTTSTTTATTTTASPPKDASEDEEKASRHGPIAEYNARVRIGRLRDDAHQRKLIQSLQDLHDVLAKYEPPQVVHPTIESLQPKAPSFFERIFNRTDSVDEEEELVRGIRTRGKVKRLVVRPMPGLPKGLYMYGDVGSGKTMLMDLFFDTLPPNIQNKSRIHFHNFMQDVHKELHKMKMRYGNDIDAIPFVAADIASRGQILCFDEFQCTDVADAMILRRLIESLMHHGVVLVTTSNRHPDDLYKNGIQRESFVPCIKLLKDQLKVLNLDSTTDYRKVSRPRSGVYHHPLDASADAHADRWFKYLGDFKHDPPHRAVQHVWGREIEVPQASGRACRFTFNELLGRATGAADYIELARSYDAFIVTDVPGMDFRSRDLARRFITFLDAVYESRAKLVLTTAVPLTQLFMSRKEAEQFLGKVAATGIEGGDAAAIAREAQREGHDVSDAMRSLMDDLGLNMDNLKKSSIFTGDEEAFAFARALSRLSEMGSQEWIERGMGQEKGGTTKEEDTHQKVRSTWHQDSS